ncbi:MAG: hypothetical protein EBS49_07050 [Verrucomicrobia bacterium]|nr:hypothetical protein [Verrucomicrobiota bacterium]
MRGWFRRGAIRTLDGLVRWLGHPIRDHRTGELLGRGFLIPWRGKILVLGLREKVRADFLPAPDIRTRIFPGSALEGFTCPPGPPGGSAGAGNFVGVGTDSSPCGSSASPRRQKDRF